MLVETIVDAGPLIAWLNTRDQWHKWSVSEIEARTGSLHTTEIVLGEACYLLGGNSAPSRDLLACVRNGMVVLHTLWPRHLVRTQELMAKFDQMDPPDASLVVLSELFPRATILTIDGDFRVYRRFRREALPCIVPR